MHWQPTDLNMATYRSFLTKDELFDYWKNVPKVLDSRKKIWNESVKKELNLTDFLQQKIYV